jgi:hypothetical protein
MRAPRPSRSIAPLRLLLAAPPALLLFAACGGPGANFPDKGDVSAAQVSWCQALAKGHGGDGWDGLAACKGDYPAASAPFLKAMAKCYASRVEAMGDKAYDDGQIATDCKDEVSFKMPGDDTSASALIDARCRWTERCAKVAVPECKAAFNKLESSQRTMLTTIYNSAARQAIADCLDGAACGSDEDAAKEACYKASNEKLLWFPH